MANSYITDGTTTIYFDTIRKFPRTRKPSQTFEQGDLDGEGAVESSGASLLTLKVTFEVITDGLNSGMTALEIWDALDDMIQNNNDISWTLSISITGKLGEQTITFTGKPNGGLSSDMSAGDPDEEVGTLGFSVETKGAIT